MGEIRYRVEKPMDSGKVYASCCALWAQVLVLALKLALSGLLPVTVVELSVFTPVFGKM